jgi:type IV pilus assembly protein PilE
MRRLQGQGRFRSNPRKQQLAAPVTMSFKQRARGFTLIELMVVVAIVGILAAVAYPSYMSYVRKTARSAAQSYMLTIAAKQEQYMLDARDYTTTIGTGGLALSAPPETVGRYTFAVTKAAGPPPTFTVAATAVGSQVSDGDLGLTSAGVKSPSAKWK